MKRGINELSIDTKTVYDRISKAENGETISYSELSQIIGRDIQQVARCNLNTARKMCHRDNDMLFDVIRNVGIKRMDDEAIAKSGTKNLTKIKRISKKSIRELSTVQNFNTLPRDAKIAHNTALSIFGALHLFTKTNSIKKVANIMKKDMKSLPINKTLELFQKG